MADTTKQQANQSFFVFVRDTNTGKIRRMAIPGDVQIGMQGNPAELQLLGRLSLAATDYSITAVNKGILNVINDDTIVSVTLVDTPPTGRITLYLPPNPRNGQLHFIKDMSGTADSVPIDVVPSPGALIDQYTSRTLTDKFGSIALYWFGDKWRILVSGLGLTNIGAADSAATYVTLSGNATLTNERRLNLSGTNLTMNDQGPNASVILDLTTVGTPGTFTYATVTVDSFGRITAASNGATPPPGGASYITVTNEPALTGERALVAGNGLLSTDAGANSSFTLFINDNIVATVSGTRFTGIVRAAGGLSGSLQTLDSGISYLIAGTGISIFTSSNGQITISSPWTNNGTSLMTTSSVSIDGQGRFPSSIGSDVYFFVSGTVGVPSGGVNARRVAAFGGDVRITGSLTVGSGSSTLTGNDLQLGGFGTRVEKSGADMKFYDLNNPQGQTLTSLIGGGGGGGGGTTVVSGTAAQSQAAYQGFTTSSVFWSATGSWTPFTGALSNNFTDVLGQSIIRSGSQFQTLNGGFYYFHASFNAYGSDAYVSLRLRNVSTNFVPIQRATYRTNPSDQNLVVCDGVVSAAIGDIFQLEYVSSGTILPWTSSNPTPDGTNMRTGQVSMFLISNLQPTTSSVWTTIYDVDFKTLPSASWASNGPQTLKGVTWQVENRASADFIGINPQTGLEFDCNAVNSDYGFATTRTAPLISTRIQNIFPQFSLADHRIRAWAMVSQTNADQATEKLTLGLERNGNYGDWGIAESRTDGGGAGGWQIQAATAGGNIVNQTPIALGGHNTIMLQYFDDRFIEVWTGLAVNGQWPSTGSMQLRGSVLMNNGVLYVHNLSGSGELGVVLAAATNNTTNTFTGSFWKFKLDYSGGPTIGASPAATPIFSTPILAGTVTTNTAHSGSKQSLGMMFFNPNTVQAFGGSSRRYFYRAIVDVTSTEPNMSASVDLYDLNGIVAFPPGIITGSIVSSSNPISTQIQAELTTQLQSISGSGIFEARLWRTVSGSLTSSVACRNARLEVEYT